MIASMSKLLRRSAATAALLLTAVTAFAQVSDHREIKTPPLRKFSMPQPKRIALPNGMVIFIQEDHDLPLIRGSVTIRGGSRDVPADKAGLVGIYTQAWRTGGTTAKSGDDLDQFLESRAAVVETTGDHDSTAVQFDTLKGDFETVFPIVLDLLKNPAFRQEKIDLAKTQTNTGISRRNDEPGAIITREAVKLGYGAGSPYTRQAEYATVASITRDDLLAFHRRTVHPNNMIVALIGDFDGRKMEKRLRDAFGSWKRGPQMSRPDPGIVPAKPGLYFIAKEDVTQANISMVHPGVERNNPDYYALAVMNEIFSGGFSGRLMQRLRSDRGLTYGVGGGVGADWDHPGLFRVQMATKGGTTLESIDALRNEIRLITTEPVTEKEMSLARESILNAFVFTMDTREKALNQQVLLEFYGFPSDYFVRYPSNIEKVTAADVSRVAQKYIHPDQLAVLVVGNESQFEKPLSSLGPVSTIDITIPALDAGSARPSASTSDAAGLALARKVAAFVGPQATLDSLQSLRRTGSMTIVTPQGEMQIEATILTRFPDSLRIEMKTPMGNMTQVASPAAAFMLHPGGTADMPGSQRDAMLADLKADYLVVLRSLASPKYVFTAAGTEKAGDVEAAVLNVNADGRQMKWLVDPATGRLLRSVSSVTVPVPGEQVTEYVEWKTFGGLNLAAVTVQSRNGQKAAEMRLSNAELNPAVDAGAFVKPEAK